MEELTWLLNMLELVLQYATVTNNITSTVLVCFSHRIADRARTSDTRFLAWRKSDTAECS